MKSIQIERGSICEGPTFSEDRKVAFNGEDLLTSLSSIVLRLRKHRFHLIKSYKIYIDDDLMGEDIHIHKILYNASGLYNHSELPKIYIRFDRTIVGDCDYKRMITVDTSTAYKRGRNVPPQEMKFKAKSISVSVENGNALSWVSKETKNLLDIANKIDVATSSLSGWIESGLSMRIVCKGSVKCNHSSNITGKRLKNLASDFASIEDFTAKLKCSQCGSKRLIIELGESDEAQ